MNDSSVWKERYDGVDNHLEQLLVAWRLRHLLPHLRKECINLEVMQMMKLQHIAHTLQGFPYGDQIRFEYHLEQWRQANGCPLGGAHVAATITKADTTRNKTDTTLNKADTPLNKTDATVNKKGTPNVDKLKDSTPKNVSTSSTATQTSTSLKTGSEPNANAIASKFPYRRLHLQQILESTDRGSQVISIFARHGRLKTRQRVSLMSLIAKYFYEHEIHLNMKMAQLMEREILELFPTEELKDYYVNGHSRIYKRYANVKHYNNRRQRTKNGSSDKRRTSSNLEVGNDESIFEISDDEMSCSRESIDGDDHDSIMESKPVVVMEPVWDNNTIDEFKPDIVPEICEQKKLPRYSPEDREHVVAAFLAGDDWAALARALGVNYKTAWGWVNRSQSKKSSGDADDRLEKVLE